jgi:SAM-dependent methyltransferase
MRVRTYEFRRCSACRTLFLAQEIDEAETAHLYAGPSYFANPDFDSAESGGYHGYLDYLEDREPIEEKFERVLERIERWQAPGSLLDVGAGPGFMVSAAARRGWTPQGIEINPWAVEFASSKLGLDVRLGTFENLRLLPAAIDAVTMMDLIEHVSKPDALVAKAAEITRPGGILGILTPDAGSPVSRLLGRRWPEVKRVPEHLILFSVSGLRALLSRHGYEVLEWHSIGKRSSLATLAADVSPIAPRVGTRLRARLAGSRIGDYQFELDPKTKFCLYARRTGAPSEPESASGTSLRFR